VVEAAQTAAGANRSVTVQVVPTSWRDITLTLAARDNSSAGCPERLPCCRRARPAASRGVSGSTRCRVASDRPRHGPVT